MNKMRHMRGALDLTFNGGSCFFRAAAYVLDVPGSELCIGTFRAATADEIAQMPVAEIPFASTVPFLHAWVEREDYVYAPTLLERFGTIPRFHRAVYYAENGAKDIVRLRRSQILKLSGEIGLSAYFRKGTPTKRNLVDALLELAGIDYAICERHGGIVPR